ncbi:MAG: FAD-dependent oxidoreductase [Acidimicrobiia bacterium]
MEITVVGAGVIGLTSAISLRRAGFEANIVAALPASETVASSVAGAIWYPYRGPADSPAAGWGRHSLEIFTAGVREGVVGLRLLDMRVLTVDHEPDPWWADEDRGFRRCGPADLVPGYSDGYLQQTVVIDVIPHLRFLQSSFEELGGKVDKREIDTLDALAGPGHLVINCAGVRAGELAGDEEVHPIRGQVVRVRGEAISRVTILDGGPLGYCYVMPHGEEAVLGGTRRPGVWDRSVSDEVTADILARTARLEPTLTSAEVVDVKVGLRPGRETVRLEHEARDGTPGIIHNYGHGGNGWSLSWGSAAEVVGLALALAD